MKTPLLVGAFLVAFFCAVPVALRLHDVIGGPALTVVTLALSTLAAWAGHTPESAAFADDVRSALADIRMSHKAAAITMGIPEPSLANQLSGKEQLSASRLASLGPEFRVALAKRMLARDGESVVVERQELCDLVNAVQALTAEHRRPRALSMSLEGAA
jgi:hypothetical protein